jgi:hypothetical protein
MKTFQEFLEEAKRVKVLRTAHYTDRYDKEKILKTGFKDYPGYISPYHPDDKDGVVYTTPSSRVGNDYGNSRVNLRLVNPKMVSTKGKSYDARDQAISAFRQGAEVVRVPNAHPRPKGKTQGSYVVVDKEVANKSIDKNPQPTMRAKDKAKRSKTQPKKR